MSDIMTEDEFLTTKEKETQTYEKPPSKLQVMQSVQPYQYSINYCQTFYS
ncbi:hypothetical protein X777_11731 [Ooceraea biroi]|uniref:Uncharacterized protein n=1 Tax=Ooceraea biroi TaxID=2015173 RepID=A0A026W3A4_OOCBI|nr:hypothetical protein X777_11731 [Ooceraea biroi]